LFIGNQDLIGGAKLENIERRKAAAGSACIVKRVGDARMQSLIADAITYSSKKD
jgi:hypothetical protein